MGASAGRRLACLRRPSNEPKPGTLYSWRKPCCCKVASRLPAPHRPGTEPRVQVGPLSVDFARRRVVLRGREVSLTPIEYELLKVFIMHRGKILTRQMLLAQVWGARAYPSTHSLHVSVAQLRHKIEPSPEGQPLIFTIPSVGYRFTDEEEP